jgi:protein-disulfide isomerase
MLLAAAALGLATGLDACNQEGSGRASSADDMVIGAANAPATLIEYGSTMCGHCREFHEAAWDILKREYIDAGKVRFVFREVLAPSQPPIPAIALAEYQLARCNAATPEQYFDRQSVLFEQQPAIFQAGSMDGVRAKLIEIGALAGLSQDQVQGCMEDPAGAERMQRLQVVLDQENVDGTPTFFLNGRRIETASIMTPDGLRATLDAAVAAGS